MHEISQNHKAYLVGLRRKNIFVTAMRILIVVTFLGLWELFSRLSIIDSFVFSSPSRIVLTFIDLWQKKLILHHTWVTVYETMVCFAFVMVLAILLATLMWLIPTVQKIFEPYIVLLNSLPKSALAPVLIVWLGNNKKTIIVAAVSVAVFGAMLSIYTGFSETDSDKIKLIKTLGGTKRHILFKLVLPGSLPTIVNAMKVNLGLSLVGVIIGEFLAAKEGLGYLIIYGSQVFKMDWVLLSIVILCLLSVVLYRIIHFFEKRL